MVIMFFLCTIAVVLSLAMNFSVPAVIDTFSPAAAEPSPTAAATASPAPTPTAEPAEREGLDSLKNQIGELTSGLGGEWGVYVKNLKTNEYLALHEREMYSASLIKLFIMAAVYNEIEAGAIQKDSGVSELLELMITESSNDAANELCTMLGGGDMLAGFEVENTHTRNIACTYTVQNTDLQDDRSNSTIPYLGRNYTSPRDCGHLLELIYRGELCGSENSAEMLGFLKAQERRHKIPSPLPEGTVTANKTGEMTGVENDAAIVYTPACDYILCVMSNDVPDNGSAADGIRDISELVYNYFNG